MPSLLLAIVVFGMDCCHRLFKTHADMYVAEFCVSNHCSKSTISDLLGLLRKLGVKDLSFKSADALLSKVSAHVPKAVKFKSEPLSVDGFDGIKLHYRDAKEMIKLVLRSPLHKANLSYNRQPPAGVYGLLESGSWWREAKAWIAANVIKRTIPGPETPGASGGRVLSRVPVDLCPVIIYSDDTNITGTGKSVHNVYMTVGILDFKCRQKVDGYDAENVY
jgi:hypothetical protein